MTPVLRNTLFSEGHEREDVQSCVQLGAPAECLCDEGQNECACVCDVYV